jgi:hypothetical protein
MMSENMTTRTYSSNNQKTDEQLNDPLIVNRRINQVNTRVVSEFPPMLNPNNHRYPTIQIGNELDYGRPKRPLTCPESFIYSNMNPSWVEDPHYIPQVDMKQRMIASQTFIENNYEYMHEYRPKYVGKSPRSLRSEMVSDIEFCSTMKELKKKERSVKNGTSSYLVRSCLNFNKADRRAEIKFDPYIPSMNTSREQREEKIKKLFVPKTVEAAKTKNFNRGYEHHPDFKNFSAYNGHLLKNKGSMLDR